MKPIIQIGTAAEGAIEVNVYYSRMKSNGQWYNRPVVEIARMGSVQMLAQDVSDVIDLLTEALAHFREEGVYP